MFWPLILAASMRVGRLLDVPGGRRATIHGVAALAMIALTGLLCTKLVLGPRYFMLPTIMVAVWLARARLRLRAT